MIKKITYVPTASSLKSLYDNSINDAIQRATINVSSTFTFTSAAGTTITTNGSCFRKSGNAVTGNVDLEVIESYDNGSVVITNKPTMGSNSRSKLEVLDSGSQFDVIVKQNGIELTTTCNIPIKAPTSLTGGTKTGMQPFKGSTDANGDLTWEVVPLAEVWFTNSPDTYNSVLSSFGFFNFDKLEMIQDQKHL